MSFVSQSERLVTATPAQQLGGVCCKLPNLAEVRLCRLERLCTELYTPMQLGREPANCFGSQLWNLDKKPTENNRRQLTETNLNLRRDAHANPEDQKTECGSHTVHACFAGPPLQLAMWILCKQHRGLLIDASPELLFGRLLPP